MPTHTLKRRRRPRPIPSSSTLEAFVDRVGAAARRVAIAPYGSWDTMPCQPGCLGCREGADPQRGSSAPAFLRDVLRV